MLGRDKVAIAIFTGFVPDDKKSTGHLKELFLIWSNYERHMNFYC
jgi:hypothetical protein